MCIRDRYGIISCLIIWVIEIVRETKRFNVLEFLKKFVLCLEETARGAISVAVTCGCAGIIVGVVTATGLGLKMANGIVELAGGSLILTMVFTMLCSLILGMGAVSYTHLDVYKRQGPYIHQLRWRPCNCRMYLCASG